MLSSLYVSMCVCLYNFLFLKWFVFKHMIRPSHNYSKMGLYFIIVKGFLGYWPSYVHRVEIWLLETRVLRFKHHALVYQVVKVSYWSPVTSVFNPRVF